MSETRDASVDDLVAEIARLRGLVYEYAQGWHWKAGPPSRERCACEGCELIRALDDVEAPRPDGGIDESSVNAVPVEVV